MVEALETQMINRSTTTHRCTSHLDNETSGSRLSRTDEEPSELRRQSDLGENGKDQMNGAEDEDEMDDSFDSVESVIESVREGKVVILVDDLDRENEGDLMVAASRITTQSMAFIIKHTSGFVCVGMDGEILDSLEIPLMVKVDKNEDQFRTAFTQTVDYRFGTTTGISAHDRALTAIKLSDPSSQPEHFTRPGHLCPLRSRKGGLLTRRGHTEAGVDLCELAGLPKVSVICELVKPGCEEGSMSRRSDCLKFARDYDLRIVSINRIHKFILSKQ